MSPSSVSPRVESLPSSSSSQEDGAVSSAKTPPSSEKKISGVAQNCFQESWSSVSSCWKQVLSCFPAGSLATLKKIAKIAIPILCAIGAVVCFMFSPLVQSAVACVFLVLGGIVLAGIAAESLRRSNYIAKMSQEAADEAEHKKVKSPHKAQSPVSGRNGIN